MATQKNNDSNWVEFNSTYKFFYESNYILQNINLYPYFVDTNRSNLLSFSLTLFEKFINV